MNNKDLYNFMEKNQFKMFFIGFAMNIIFYFSWLFVPAFLFIFLGMFFRSLLYIGLSLLCADIVLSLIEQIRIELATKNLLAKGEDSPLFKNYTLLKIQIPRNTQGSRVQMQQLITLKTNKHFS